MRAEHQNESRFRQPDGGAPPPVGTTNDSSTSSEAGRVSRVPFGKRLLRWTLAMLVSVVLLAFSYRWAGTTTLRGSVQRVYEKEAHYRVEFIESSGEVHVLENEVTTFPYFKSDSADLQAALHRYARTGDIVDVKAWGFRASFLSVFPNIVEVDFVRSGAERQEARTRLVTQAVIDELIDQGIVRRGEESERMRQGLERAIETAQHESSPTDETQAASMEVQP